MNIQQKSILAGSVLGALLGAAAGYLFSRGLEMPRPEQDKGFSLRSIPPGQLVAVFIAIMGVLRGIAELGEEV